MAKDALAAFEADARETTRRRAEYVSLIFALVFTVAFVVGQLVGGAGADVERTWLPVQIAASLGCWLALRRSRIGKKEPVLVASVFQIVNAGAGGLLLGELGGLDGPFFYGIYTLPALVLGLPCPLDRRVILTMAVEVPFCVGYFGPNPSYLEHPFLHVPILYMITTVIVSILTGHWIYALMRDRFLFAATIDAQREELAKHNEVLSQEVVEKSGALQQLVARMGSARQDERAHIARNLHDDIGQLIVGARIELANLERTLGDESKEFAFLHHILEGLSKSTRSIVGELRSDDKEACVRDDIDAMIAPLRGRSKVSIETEVDAAIVCCPKTRETVCRVVQEALTNVFKHANAERVRILGRRSGEQLVFEIEDDGQGFDGVGSDGYGLIGMKERAKMANGEIEIVSRDDGTRVCLSLPLASASRSSSAEVMA